MPSSLLGSSHSFLKLVFIICSSVPVTDWGRGTGTMYLPTLGEFVFQWGRLAQAHPLGPAGWGECTHGGLTPDV